MSPRRLWKATNADILSVITCNARIGHTSESVHEDRVEGHTWDMETAPVRQTVARCQRVLMRSCSKGLKEGKKGEPDPTW